MNSAVTEMQFVSDRTVDVPEDRLESHGRGTIGAGTTTPTEPRIGTRPDEHDEHDEHDRTGLV